MIAYNSSTGVVVKGASSTSDTIRQNSIYNNPANSQSAQGILLENGANSGQQPPTSLTVTSAGGQTTIKGDYSGYQSGVTYTLEFFASAIGDNNQPDQAHIFLGSSSLVTTGTSGTFAVTLPVTLSLTQFVTATATSPAGDTSEFAAEASVENPFLVTTTADSGFGSLRQAILNVNADSTSSAPDTISFAIGTTPATITLASLLPEITHAVIIDGTTQPGYAGAPIIAIDGGGVSPYGLQIATGNSTIKGLDIINVAGDGIDIEASGDIVQSNYLGINLAGTAAGPGNQVGILINGFEQHDRRHSDPRGQRHRV